MSIKAGVTHTERRQQMIREAPLYERLDRLSKQQPFAPALVSTDSKILTFQQLSQFTRIVSESLVANGLSRDARIAVIMRPGIEQAAALIAATATAICVPLNQNTPRQEWSFYLKSTGVQAILVTAETEDLVCEIARGMSLSIFKVRSLWAEESLKSIADGKRSKLRPNDRRPLLGDDALILSTSGTTAKPKGVVITQYNLFLDAKNTIDVLQLTSDDVLMNVLPLHHAHGLSAVFAAISVGGKVICGGQFKADQFLQCLGTLGPTWFTASPTIYFELVAELARTPLPSIEHSLRFFRSMSAPLPRNLLLELESVFQIPVIEAYGMTEATSQIASNPLPPSPRKPGSVGCAAGTMVKIIGADGRQLPPSHWGDVVVEGATIARGYLAAENDKRNVVPLSAVLPTGDVGYEDEDGYIFLVGRKKDIINRGGEKISPTAVEAVLLLHQAISEVVVFALPHPRLGEEVGAAVVLKKGVKATSSDVRTFAADSGRLLLSHIPKLVSFVDSIPKNQNGKVLRRVVSEEFADSIVHRSEDRTPNRNFGENPEILRNLSDVWRLALNVKQVDGHSNFFQLGGDSLAAEHIIAGVDEQFNCELTLRELFDSPTIISLAELIENKKDSQIVASRHIGASSSFADNHKLSYRQAIMFDAQHSFPNLPIFNLPFAFEFRGKLNTGLLIESIKGIINRHPALRTQFTKVDGQLTADAILPGSVTFDLECEDWSAISKARLADFIYATSQKEGWRRIDLSEAPLARFRLLRFDNDHHVLLVTFHHIVWDGWSMRIFLQELRLALSSEEDLSTPMLSAIDTFIRPYTVDNDGSRLSLQDERQLEYWKAQFADASNNGSMETKVGERGAVPLTGNLRFDLHADSVKAVDEFNRTYCSTIFVTLLSAYMVLLGGRFAVDKVSTTIPVANRQRHESKLVLGLHANTILVTASIRRGHSFLSVVEAVREDILSARGNQDIPFELLLKKLFDGSSGVGRELLKYTFTYENDRDYEWTTDKLGVTQCTTVAGQGQTTLPFGHADLMLAMNGAGDYLSGSLYFREGVISSAVAREIISDLSEFLINCKVMAERPLEELLDRTRQLNETAN